MEDPHCGYQQKKIGKKNNIARDDLWLVPHGNYLLTMRLIAT
jgi:hypothetical protein